MAQCLQDGGGGSGDPLRRRCYRPRHRSCKGDEYHRKAAWRRLTGDAQSCVGAAASPTLQVLERFQAKWKPVRVKKTRQIKNLEPRFDSIETEKALAEATYRASRGSLE